MNDKPLRVFIGYDSRESAAYHVLCHSILRHASGPVSITPLVQAQLRERGLYLRERGKTESTEFSLTRFLVPYLSSYGDYSIFMDCDMLFTADIYELMKLVKKDEKKEYRAVWCVQHEYTPKTKIKMDGCQQTMYPRKNWSSLMVFRNKFCERLTPEYVNMADGKDLHRMVWAGADPKNIGSLPLEWNWLVGEYGYSQEEKTWHAPVGDLLLETNEMPKVFHWTLGGPWFFDYRNCEHANLWYKESDLAFPSVNMPKPKELVEA